MTKQRNTSSDPLGLLSIFESGVLTVEVNGFPFAKLDAESRSLDLEARGIKECGIKLSKLVELEGGEKGIKGIIFGSETTAKRLSEKGWSLTLYDKGSRILKIGRGVSRLTGHVEVNILKVRRIFENL